jgi:hypothetical protein
VDLFGGYGDIAGRLEEIRVEAGNGVEIHMTCLVSLGLAISVRLKQIGGAAIGLLFNFITGE